MNILESFENTVKPRAIAFIDYEYWFYTCNKCFGTIPDPTRWFNEMSKRYDLSEIMVFGCFTHKDLAGELARVRAITNLIITTDGTGTDNNRKAITDFIMLDAIYQKAAEYRREDQPTYILFTGDGHFHSVSKYLRYRCGAKLVIAGIKSNISYQLQTVANEIIEYHSPDVTNPVELCRKWIANNFKEVYTQNDRPISPTFSNVSQIISAKHGVDISIVRLALSKMIDAGYFAQVERTLPDGRMTRNLIPNWDKLCDDGLLDVG